jgi:peptidase M28-like protein
VRIAGSMLLVAALVLPQSTFAQDAAPPQVDQRIYDIIEASSADRVEATLRTLVGFGTRNTFSDTLSDTRGIGAARRWINAEFGRISSACGDCLEVGYQNWLVGPEQSRRLPNPVNIVNVVAIQRGTTHPNRYIIMAGDIDSRNSNGSDGEGDAPGANDNGSGMSGVLEAARLLTRYEFGSSIVYLGLSGEEQGLFGGQRSAEIALEEGWDIVAVLNNDMIGNIQGVDGVIENNTFRVFSEATPVTEDLQARQRYRTFGGEIDGPSRQVARYVEKTAQNYFPNMRAIMIYRLDRFGRGGHHTPFNNKGFPGVRIMETHENYNRQHQNLRTENGIAYGDVLEGVNFEYASVLTAINATTMAQLAWAPPQPTNVLIGGAVQPSTKLSWDAVDDPGLAGYKIYWRDTTAPQWQYSRWVGTATEFTLEGVVIDNYLFGVAAVGQDGNESVVVFPSGRIRRRR